MLLPAALGGIARDRNGGRLFLRSLRLASRLRHHRHHSFPVLSTASGFRFLPDRFRTTPAFPSFIPAFYGSVPASLSPEIGNCTSLATLGLAGIGFFGLLPQTIGCLSKDINMERIRQGHQGPIEERQACGGGSSSSTPEPSSKVPALFSSSGENPRVQATAPDSRLHLNCPWLRQRDPWEGTLLLVLRGNRGLRQEACASLAQGRTWLLFRWIWRGRGAWAFLDAKREYTRKGTSARLSERWISPFKTTQEDFFSSSASASALPRWLHSSRGETRAMSAILLRGARTPRPSPRSSTTPSPPSSSSPPASSPMMPG